ncbi:MAG: VOC family protein [Planctomycetota bacterium]|jgi:catechol 2,3-dioxygenase-like lactoylglutathione lyase family enzyme
MSTSNPRPNIRFLHRLCADVDAMRRFYGEGVGMPEVHYRNDEQHGWVTFESDGFQFMFHRFAGAMPDLSGYAWQPGDEAGTEPRHSLGIEVPAQEFAATVARLRAQHARAMTPAPTWRRDCYWGWTLNDPAGETVELWFEPAERPAGDPPRWPD